MSKFANGFYQVSNPDKYVGKKSPHFRSSWEHSFMQFCDTNPAIQKWASEAISIPYRDPLTNRNTIYVPDFFIQYRTRGNTTRAEIIEIKPKKQSIIESKMNSRDRAVVVINLAKWQAANQWCKRAGLAFRVLTEDQIFHQGNKR